MPVLLSFLLLVHGSFPPNLTLGHYILSIETSVRKHIQMVSQMDHKLAQCVNQVSTAVTLMTDTQIDLTLQGAANA